MQKIFYIISTTFFITSIIALVVFGLPLGIDFKGGSLMELQFLPDSQGNSQVLSRDQIEQELKEVELGPISIQKGEDSTLLLRFKAVDEQVHQIIIQKLEVVSNSLVEEQRFDSVGPVIGKETINKTVKATALVLIMIIAYVAFAFRKVSFPIKSWRYGLIAVITSFHDVIIALGIFSVYLYFKGGEVGVSIVAASLTILGYSVNDTIVVFDRIRENLLRFGNRSSFNEIIRNSIRETMVRSINTSLATVLVLLAVFFFGGPTIHDFALVLSVGIIVGTYSSIAIASPLLGSWVNWKKKKTA
ncbi:MAG: protein-export membrane protein SecF [Candidatus Spechtbacteria bacterium RIFCSPLOWO2_01_FULL_38_20]|nr:MAG: protein-export membrane protein SecF [Candidatus Spechtbacteria bacterium RIFCSPLOWO2_01_FULL_38_20]